MQSLEDLWDYMEVLTLLSLEFQEKKEQEDGAEEITQRNNG